MLKIIIVIILKLFELSAWMKAYGDSKEGKNGDLCLHFFEGVILTAINCYFVFS